MKLTDEDLLRFERRIGQEFDGEAHLTDVEMRQLLAEIRELRAQRDPLRPLTPQEIEDALNEGRAESMAARGDNAFAYLLRERDAYRSMLCDLVADRKFAVEGREATWARARELLKNGPKETPR